MLIALGLGGASLLGASGALDQRWRLIEAVWTVAAVIGAIAGVVLALVGLVVALHRLLEACRVLRSDLLSPPEEGEGRSATDLPSNGSRR
jgi:hypothetical protein